MDPGSSHLPGALRDPNFPEGLRIVPSSRRRTGDAGAQRVSRKEEEHSSDKAAWDVDSQRDIEDFGIAGRIWEAAYLLVRYLTPPEISSASSSSCILDPPPSLYEPPTSREGSGLCILELGSGVGYVGLHLARQLSEHLRSSQDREERATLVLTDLENVVPLMRRNAELAGFAREGEGEADDARQAVDVLVRPLPWGNCSAAASILSELDARRSRKNQNKDKASLTHIVASDLVYFPELLAPLLRSLIDLTSPPASAKLADGSVPGQNDAASGWTGPELIMAYKVRSLTKEQPFWNALGAWFQWDVVTCRYQRADVAQGRTQSERDDDVPSHRFGELQMDLEPLQGDVSDAKEPALDDYFIFVARRRQDSLHCRAPTEDVRLMDGWRESVSEAVGSWSTKEGEGEERQAKLHRADGTDAFENMLLGMMAL